MQVGGDFINLGINCFADDKIHIPFETENSLADTVKVLARFFDVFFVF